MNVLLTSAGRRTYMVDYFRKALEGDGLLYAANSVKSPALACTDGAVLTPLIYDSGYIPFLLDFCKKHAIGLLVPLFDIDLPVLAKHKAAFQEVGVTVAVSSPETLLSCNDKYQMFLKLWRSKIRCPETCLTLEDALLELDAGSLSWPVVIKPRFGMGSIGIALAYDKNELRAFYQSTRRAVHASYLQYESAAAGEESVLIQERREGNEYGLDVVQDFAGNYVTTIVRRKLAMRAGETDEAVILGKNDKEYAVLTELGQKIAVNFDHIGNMDVDVIMNPDNLAPYVIDMNARFGGGYPFSHLAGADLPRAYVAWAKGEKAPASCFLAKAGVHGYKDIVVRAY